MAPTPIHRKGRLGEHTLPLALAGILLWLIAALAVRVLSGVFDSPWRSLGACLAMIPLAELVLLTFGAMLGIERRARLPAAAWLGIVVIACHTLGLMLWPQLYGADPAVVRHGAAWLGWAAICPAANAWFWSERA
jgi:hypothetical protein